MIRLTSTTSIFLNFSLILFDAGTIARLKPSFCASLMRFSRSFTGLISPDHPISPMRTVFISAVMSFKQVVIAIAIPKSAAGSEISIPPITFT